MGPIIKSIAILCFISTIIATSCFYLGLKFIPSFTLATIIQFVVWTLFKYWVDSNSQIQLETLINERIKEFRTQSLDCKCPDENCNFVDTVPIVINDVNYYTCTKCKKEIKVYIGCKTFLITTPLDGDPFKNHNFVENKEYDT